MSLWKEKGQPHIQLKLPTGRCLESPSIGTSAILMEGNPPCLEQAGFHLSGCGEQSCIMIGLRAALEVAGLPAAHLAGKVWACFWVFSHQLGTVPRNCTTFSANSVAPNWIWSFQCISRSELTQVCSSLACLPFRAWVKGITGSERNWIACHIRLCQKIRFVIRLLSSVPLSKYLLSSSSLNVEEPIKIDSSLTIEGNYNNGMYHM